MALVLKDRVLESSTSTGTGSFTLTGAQTGYQSFSAIGNGNTTYYTIQGKNPDGTLTGEWEVGVGTWSTGNTLSRDTVLSNSLGTTAKIVFSAGAKDVFCDYPASKSVNQNADNKVLIPYTPGVTNTGSLNVGSVTAHTDSGVIAAFTASEPLYLYTSLQNTSTANTSYASYAVNDGGHTSYGELGINNSNYSYSAAGFPNNTFSAPLATFVESYGGPLAIGTWDSQKISFIVNGSVNTADAMTISASGVVSLGTALGVTSGGTGTTTSTGTGSVVLSDNPTFTTNISSPVVNFNRFDFQTLVSTWDDVNHLGAINIGSDVPFFNDTIREINIGTNTGASGAQTYITIGDANSSTALNGSLTFSNAATFPSGLTVSGTLSGTAFIALVGSPTANQTLATNQTTGSLTIGGTGNSTGTISIASGTGAQTIAIANATSGAKTVNIASGASSATKTINIGTSGTGTTNIAIGATAGTSTTTVNGYFKPPALASAPTYVKGAVYFDTTLNKLRVGGATTWETITSI
jgi:hypothetical protein